MPSFNPFTAVTGKHAFTLFEIRLQNDFIVFRGNEHESSGQLLQGTVVLCLPAPLKIEDIHLRLTGSLHLGWTDYKVTAAGMSSQKVDKNCTILSHRWAPFVGIGASDSSSSAATSTKGVTLSAGNYEWPFEFMLPGHTTETVEGLHEANITYKLKATVARGILAYDLHAYKRFRVIRTLESSALEFLHAMSVENLWPNKVEYSIVIPRKAIVFGTTIPLSTRITPLLKGLDIADMTIQLVENVELVLQSATGLPVREHKQEREVAHWKIPVSKEEHWQDMIEDTGQEGWMMNASLDLPRKLSKCLQDVNAEGIKIRHRLKIIVAIKNPDGHVSELRAALPVTIYISPNMPLDEDGNMVRHLPDGKTPVEAGTAAPPGYGEHVLDQLYEDCELADLQTPATQTPATRTPANQSGINSPFYAQSRAGSADNLAAMLNSSEFTPAALSSRLQSMTLDASRRNSSWHSFQGSYGTGEAYTPRHPHEIHSAGTQSGAHSTVPSAPLSRQVSDDGHSSGSNTPEHLDFAQLSELSKVPSYKTAVKTPVRPLSLGDGTTLPDYLTAMTSPGSPEQQVSEAPLPDPLATVMEESSTQSRDPSPSGQRPRPPTPRRRQTTPHVDSNANDDERRRLNPLHFCDRGA